MSAFADVLIPDGCAFKIAAALAGILPGTGTPAEFKLHAVYSVRAGGLADLRGSAGLRQRMSRDLTRVAAEAEGLMVSRPRRRILRARMEVA